MSYRPPEQAIAEHCVAIREGIESLESAAIKRLESGEWTEEHCDKLTDLLKQLIELKYKLIRLEQETW